MEKKESDSDDGECLESIPTNLVKGDANGEVGLPVPVRHDIMPSISEDQTQGKSANADPVIAPVIGRGRRLMIMAAAAANWHQPLPQANIVINNNIIYNNFYEGAGKEMASKNNEEKEEEEEEAAECEKYEEIYVPIMRRNPDRECFECGKRGHYGRDCEARITLLMKDRNYNYKDPAQRNIFYLLQENRRLKEKFKKRENVFHDMENKIKTLENKLHAVYEAAS